MKAAAFEYHVARNLDQALELMGRLEDARVLAGGQSLMPMLNLRLASPRHLIDLNRVPELAYIREIPRVDGRDGSGGQPAIGFGAMTRQRDIEFSGLVAQKLPLFAEAVRSVGHRQTRNRGTIGGSLCHLDPSAELPVAAMAMDAVLKVASHRGRRDIEMRDFSAGYMTPSLEPDEILTDVLVQPWTGRYGCAFLEYARRHGDFAVVSVAVLVELDAQERILRAAITLGGVAAGPIRIAAAERAMTGRAGDESAVEAAADECGRVEAQDDAFFPAWYRQQLARTLSGRALRTALERARAAA
jgi:carbon-monoxide dehydrogenase medium subunit